MAAIKLALKNKRDLTVLKTTKDIQLTQGKSLGALHVIQTLAKRLGVIEALGDSKQGKIAFWQLYARLISQGSRQTSLKLSKAHETGLISGFPLLNEKALYKNLAWLSEHQVEIEKALLNKHKVETIFLYDVTSSYLEGHNNERSAYGYNRDGKKGKKQIVIGLLTDEKGCPIAVRVFEGNTSDTKTFGDQITLLKETYAIDNVVIVGDGGMIKRPQQSLLPEDYTYITSLSKKEINTLLKEKVIQLGLFDKDLCEVFSQGCRYIFRRNDLRKRELEAIRKEKEARLFAFIKEQNTYLSEHPKARVAVALRKIEEKAKQFKLSWVSFTTHARGIIHSIDESRRFEAAKLEGCYCLKSTVPEAAADKTVLHDRYKSLSKVERAFRTMKTQHLEIRPLFLRKKSHTQGHVFIVMLAYLIQREMEASWKDLGLTVKEGLHHLSTYTSIEVKSKGKDHTVKIPKPNSTCQSLMEALSIKAPTQLIK